MDLVAHVLSLYPAALRGRGEFLGNRGGFSGARLWKIHTPAGPLCLRAGALSETVTQLRERHRLMALLRGQGLFFVPTVLASSQGDTALCWAGRCWELLEWLPGKADFRQSPTLQRLRAAAHALAQVHLFWEREGTKVESPCPAVLRRLRVVQTDQPLACRSFPQMGLLLQRWLPRLPEMLRQARTPTRVQMCLRDIWHDHLLYEGDRLTGLVDYAAIGLDSVAADLARMLGSLVADEEQAWHQAVAAYREVRALSLEEERLARVLDRTGVIGALAHWLRVVQQAEENLRRSRADRRGSSSPEISPEGIEWSLVANRVQQLLDRVERWSDPEI